MLNLAKKHKKATQSCDSAVAKVLEIKEVLRTRNDEVQQKNLFINQLDESLSGYDQRLADRDDKIAEQKAELLKAQKELEYNAELQQALSSSDSLLDDRAESIRALNGKLAETETVVVNLTSRLQAAEAKATEQESVLLDAQTKIEEMKARQSEIQAELEETKVRHRECEEEKETSAKKLDELKAQCAEYENTCDGLRSEKAKVEKKLHDIKLLCNDCETTGSEHHSFENESDLPSASKESEGLKVELVEDKQQSKDELKCSKDKVSYPNEQPLPYPALPNYNFSHEECQPSFQGSISPYFSLPYHHHHGNYQ